ncbi:MAG: hypothetical protein JSU67_13580 [Gammaproteobacteria bacterium]|nr:MAG: hypothetical protein JSU67_13580 [Gammaproteobacteria bacterium]
MPRSPRLNPVAQGAETPEQYDFLKVHDCHAFRGRHIQEPLPLSSVGG